MNLHTHVPSSNYLVSLDVVRMIWWFLIVAVAAGAALWAFLAAYVWVRQRLRNAENKPAETDHPAA